MSTKQPDVFAIRRANLRALIKQRGGPGSLSKQLGYSSGSYIAQLAGPSPSREVSEDVARQIERKLDLPYNWMDREEQAQARGQSRPAADASTPLIASVFQVVYSVAAQSKISISPEKQSEIATLVYEHAVLTGQVDEGYAKRLIRLMGK